MVQAAYEVLQEDFTEDQEEQKAEAQQHDELPGVGARRHAVCVHPNMSPSVCKPLQDKETSEELVSTGKRQRGGEWSRTDSSASTAAV